MLPKGKDTKSTTTAAAEDIGNAANPRTTADTTAAPAATAEPQVGRENPNFHYPTVKRFTGRLQYASNRMAEAQLGHGKVLRAEVFAVRNERYANSLVENGDVSHVAADTPLGQPEEYKAGKKLTPPDAPATDTATTQTGSTATATTGSGGAGEPK